MRNLRKEKRKLAGDGRHGTHCEIDALDGRRNGEAVGMAHKPAGIGRGMALGDAKMALCGHACR